MKRGRSILAAFLTALALCVGFATAASAQLLAQYDYEDLEFRGVGAEALRVWPVGVEAANGVGLRLDLGLIGPRVRIMPTARYWGSSLNSTEVDRLASQIILVCERQPDPSCPAELDLGEVKLSDLELAIDGHFLVLGDRMISPYVGAGLALHLLNGSGDFINGTFVEDLLDSVTPGIGALGGVTVRLASSLAIVAEARFMLASDVRYSGASVGGVWTLPRPLANAADLLSRYSR